MVHAGHVNCVHATKEKHAQAVRNFVQGDFVQAEHGKGEDDKLRLDVGELQSAIYRTRRGSLLLRRTGYVVELLKKWRSAGGSSSLTLNDPLKLNGRTSASC